jgi:hypothetical protein
LVGSLAVALFFLSLCHCEEFATKQSYFLVFPSFWIIQNLINFMRGLRHRALGGSLLSEQKRTGKLTPAHESLSQ